MIPDSNRVKRSRRLVTGILAGMLLGSVLKYLIYTLLGEEITGLYVVFGIIGGVIGYATYTEKEKDAEDSDLEVHSNQLHENK